VVPLVILGKRTRCVATEGEKKQLQNSTSLGKKNYNLLRLSEKKSKKKKCCVVGHR
jgi:hypothetical protein